MSINRTTESSRTGLEAAERRPGESTYSVPTLLTHDQRPLRGDIGDLRLGGVRVTLSRDASMGPDLVREAAEVVGPVAAYRANKSSLTSVQAAAQVLNEVGQSRKAEEK